MPTYDIGRKRSLSTDTLAARAEIEEALRHDLASLSEACERTFINFYIHAHACAPCRSALVFQENRAQQMWDE